MSLDRKELLASLKNSLESYFKDQGFSIKIESFSKGWYNVYRKTDYGNELIKLGANDYKNYFGLNVSSMVCFKEVTNLLKIGRGMDEDFDLNFTFTLVEFNEIDELWNHTVRSVLDVDKWCQKNFIPYFENYAKPFFSKFSTLSKVNEVLNSNPEEESIYIRRYEMRAQIGIIVAKLINHKLYDDLSLKYYQKLKKKRLHTDYEKVMNYLKTVEE